MHVFKDTEGRAYSIEVNVLAIKKVRAHCNINLLDVLDVEQGSEGLLARLADDPVLLAEILYAICVPDQEKTGESENAFMAAMAGEVVEQATMALLEEIADFFPKAKGALLRKVLEMARGQERKAVEAIEQMLQSGELEQGLQEAMSGSAPPSMKSPESSESTPQDSPSGS
jgi:hypothetical protein